MHLTFRSFFFALGVGIFSSPLGAQISNIGLGENIYPTTSVTVSDSIIPNFGLRSTDNKTVSLDDFPQAKGYIIIFTCNHCPFAKLYTQRINDLQKQYQEKGVPVLAINSMDTLIYNDESFAHMQEKARSQSYHFPYLQDASQAVGRLFGAEHTPTAYVIWKENNGLVIKYKGAIDDNGENPTIAVPFISIAVDELLSGKAVSQPETPSFGCRIFYRK